MRRTRMTPIQRMTVATGVILGLLRFGGPVLDAVGDMALDTAAHVHRVVPDQGDADSYACARAEVARDPASGEWLIVPDDPDLLDC